MRSGHLRTLEILLEVERGGSYSAAAQALGLTRAAVSRNIAEAEKRLGVRLARRTTRQVVLTPAARELLRRVTQPLEDIKSALAAVEEAQDALSGPIRLSCSHGFARRWLLPLLEDFQARYSRVSLEVALSDRLENLITSPIDLAIRMGRPYAENIVARQLGRLPVVLVAAPGFAHLNTLEALRGAPRIGFRIPGTQRIYQWRLRSPAGELIDLACADSRLVLDSVEAITDLARRGAGVAALGRFLVEDALRTGELIQILPDHTLPAVECYVCYYHREHIPQRVRELIQVLMEAFPA